MRKKLLSLLLTFLIASATTASSLFGAYAWIGDSYNTEQACISSFLTEMKDMPEYAYETVSYTRENLYNSAGDLAGYMYSLTFDGTRYGYAMCDIDSGAYTITEMFMGSLSPYSGYSGIKLYPTFMTYIVKNGDTYYDIVKETEVDLSAVQALEEQGFGFNGTGTATDDTFTVYYDHKEVTTTKIADEIPDYTGGVEGTNTCTPKAGLVVIGYWDKFKENLIPNFSTYTTYLEYVIWRNETDEICDTGNRLYTYMQTNVNGLGTTIPKCKTGLTNYAADYGGYSVTYRSVMSGGSYNLNGMLTEFNANRPIMMFFNPYYNYVSFNQYVFDGGETNAKSNYSGSHTMVAYGYRNVKYYNANDAIIQQDEYLLVNPVMQTCTKGMLKLNDDFVSMNDAFSVEII